MKKYHIAVLLHESDNEHTLNHALIKDYSRYWREDGHEVIYIYGTKHFIPADVVIVHVDLSVVPDEYLEFAKQYPVALNAGIKDIRKSVISEQNLNKDDIWSGSVIVKSNNNCAGIPERIRNSKSGRVGKRIMRLMNRLPGKWFLFPLTSNDYKIFDNLSQVPKSFFYRSDIVVQKFTPEIDDGLYCVRNMTFIGDHVVCTRLKSNHPVVKGGNSVEIENGIKVHPDMLQLQYEMGFDYGKFDYVEVDGKAILLDANKTVGFSARLDQNTELSASRRYRAEGLYSYLKG